MALLFQLYDKRKMCRKLTHAAHFALTPFRGFYKSNFLRIFSTTLAGSGI